MKVAVQETGWKRRKSDDRGNRMKVADLYEFESRQNLWIKTMLSLAKQQGNVLNDEVEGVHLGITHSGILLVRNDFVLPSFVQQ